MNVEKQDKLYELDYVRFIACLAVIIVHITATGVTDYIQGSLPYILSLIINRSFKFTTPIFIFLSGVTSFYSYRKKEFKYFTFIKRRLKKVLVAYLIWCVIYYLAYVKLGAYDLSIGTFVKNVIYGTMSYHLYFVIIITQMYIVGPLFYKVLKDSRKRVLVLAVSVVLTALFAEYLRFQYADRIFLKYVFFYMLGIYVTLEYEKFLSFIIKYKVFIVLGYILSSAIYTAVSYLNLTIYIYVWFVFSLFSTFFVYYVGLVSKKVFRNIYEFVKLFSQSSYYIYLMHPLVLTYAILYTTNHGILSVTKRLIIYSVTVIPITVISCLFFTFIKDKLKKNKKAALAASD